MLGFTGKFELNYFFFLMFLCIIIKESDGQGCPFCRAEIKGTESIVVDPFDPRRQHKAGSTGNLVELDEDDEVEEQQHHHTLHASPLIASSS